MASFIHLPTLAACAAFAGKEQARPQISGVHVCIGPNDVTYVATNGHILAARIVANSSFAQGQLNETLGNWTIPTVECKAFKIGKRDTFAMATLNFSNSKISLSYDNATRTFAPIDASYPDWHFVIPNEVTGTVGESIRFNGDYISTIQNFGERLDLGEANPHWNGDGPSIFTFSHGGDNTFCLLMPMRRIANMGNWQRPDWTRAEYSKAKAA